MDFHYDAFISYNHNPRDLMITKMLQQKLESFKIPEDVNSKTGKTKIERVFLDRGELEVAGNLSDSIRNAIENSDKLIVICSPGGHESPWVEKEIELFLEKHTKDDILTVLTEGEPLDVIPEVLLYKEIEEEDGNITREPAEPLSCDYRGDVKEANKTELPRLVAAIIGCRYDDLVQRKKQYRMKIMTRVYAALAALMVLVTTFFIWNGHRFKVAYENNLIEQSKSLAIQSERALESGDRVQAILYALEALPSEDEPDRPVVAEAVRALSRSLDLYRTPDEEWLISTREYKKTDNHNTTSDQQITGFDVHRYDDDCFIAARYGTGDVAAWDAETGERILTEEISKCEDSSDGYHLRNPFFADGRKLLLGSYKKFFCIDIDSGEELWTFEVPKDSISQGIDGAWTRKNSVWCSFNDEDNAKHLLRLDLDNGQIQEDYTVDYYPSLMELSGDGLSAVFVCKQFDDDYNVTEDDVYMVSPEHKEPVKIGAFQCVTDTGFTEDGDVLVYGFSERPDDEDYTQYSWADMTFGKRLIFTRAKEKTALLKCFGRDGTSKWDTEITDIFCDVPQVTIDDGREARDGLISCTTGETLRYLDKSGNVVEVIRFGEPVVAYSQPDDYEEIVAVLLDGSYALYDFETKELSRYKGSFHGTITRAEMAKGGLYVVSSNVGSARINDRLLRYSYGGSDSKWTELTTDDMDYKTLDDIKIAVHDGKLSILLQKSEYSDDYSDSWYINEVNTIDISSGELVSSDSVRIEDVSWYAGADPEAGMFYDVDLNYEWSAEKKVTIYSVTVYGVSFEGGKCETHTVELPEDPADPYCDIRYDILGCGNGKIYACIDKKYNDDTKKLCLITIDTNTWTAETADLEGDSASDKYDDPPSFIDSDGERVIVSNGGKVTAWGFDGKIQSELEDPGFVPVSVGALDTGDLFLVEGDVSGNILHIYDKNWKQKNTVEIRSVGGSSDSGQRIEIVELPGGDKMISDKYNGVIMTPDFGSVLTDVTGFRGFDASTGMMILKTTSGEVGKVPYRTLDEMIAEGHEAAGDIEQEIKD